MYKIIKSAFVEFKEIEDEKINVIRAEIICDSASDLPDADSIDGMELSVGSIAWAIDTGAFYGLSSEGTWYNQDGSGAAGAKNSLQSNTAASPDKLIKQAVELSTIEGDIIPNDIAETKGDEDAVRNTENI